MQNSTLTIRFAKKTKSALFRLLNLPKYTFIILVGHLCLRQAQLRDRVVQLRLIVSNWIKYRLPIYLINIDYFLSRTLFGNVAFVGNNLVGLYRQYKAQVLSQPKLMRQPNAVARTCQKAGYVILPEMVDASILGAILEKYELMIEDDRCSRSSVGSVLAQLHPGTFYSREIPNIHEKIPELEALLTPENISLIEDYYQSYFQVEMIQGYRNYYAPPEVADKVEVFSNWWHCDARPTDEARMMINLSDVSEQDGPFHIVSTTRTRELIQAGFRQRWNYGNAVTFMEDREHITRLVGPKGTMMLCNTTVCLHRADLLAPNRTRDMLLVQFYSSKTPLRKDWFARIGQERLT